MICMWEPEKQYQAFNNKRNSSIIIFKFLVLKKLGLRGMGVKCAILLEKCFYVL